MNLKLLQVLMNAMVRISAQFKTLSAKLMGRKRCLENPGTRLNVFSLNLSSHSDLIFFLFLLQVQIQRLDRWTSVFLQARMSLFSFSTFQQEVVYNNFLKCQQLLQMKSHFLTTLLHILVKTTHLIWIFPCNFSEKEEKWRFECAY